MQSKQEDKILAVLTNEGKPTSQISIEAGVNFYRTLSILKILAATNKIKIETNEKGTRIKYAKVDENGNDINRMA